MKKTVLTLIVGCALMAQAAAQSGAPRVKSCLHLKTRPRPPCSSAAPWPAT